MAIQIQFRRGTASEWTAANPILAQAEMGIETDTRAYKIGNGATAWASLPYGGIENARRENYINLVMPGNIVPPVVGVARYYPPTPITITKVYANVSSPVTGGNFTFQLNKNGTDTGLTLEIVSGSAVMQVVNSAINLLASDYLTLDATGSVSSIGLHVKLEFEGYTP
jgi:hypothetical protein